MFTHKSVCLFCETAVIFSHFSRFYCYGNCNREHKDELLPTSWFCFGQDLVGFFFFLIKYQTSCLNQQGLDFSSDVYYNICFTMFSSVFYSSILCQRKWNSQVFVGCKKEFSQICFDLNEKPNALYVLTRNGISFL